MAWNESRSLSCGPPNSWRRSTKFIEASGPPAWKTIPSWDLIGTDDHVIPEAAQRAMAATAHSRISTFEAGHLGLISKAGAVLDVVLRGIHARSSLLADRSSLKSGTRSAPLKAIRRGLLTIRLGRVLDPACGSFKTQRRYLRPAVPHPGDDATPHLPRR